MVTPSACASHRWGQKSVKRERHLLRITRKYVYILTSENRSKGIPLSGAAGLFLSFLIGLSIILKYDDNISGFMTWGQFPIKQNRAVVVLR